MNDDYKKLRKQPLCPKCDGTGHVERLTAHSGTGRRRKVIVTCGTCKGTGRDRRCSYCGFDHDAPDAPLDCPYHPFQAIW